MELTETHKKKVKQTTQMAFASCGILLLALIVNSLRETLLGIKEGYAPSNFSFNFIFFLPLMVTALGLGLAVIGRTIKYWNNWTSLNRKLIIIGLSTPAIMLWLFIITKIILTIPD